MSTQQFEEELQYLNTILDEMERQLIKLEGIPVYKGSDVTEQVLEGIRENNRRNLRLAKNEPYFGRMDFEEEHKDSVPIYIGKVGVSDQATENPVVIDWRAPIASMFYSFTGGDDPAYYESPEGIIEGIIYLKRNIVIRKKNLQRVVDTYVKGNQDLSVTDDFLLYRLSENKDNRLKDIVSTIQSEQNDIIRSSKNTPLVIQGVAGSGKTTVALHRLAFLIYQYRETLKADKMIIFAPNNMFLDYISNVLPELGVGGIQQTTFSDWALTILDYEVKLKDSSENQKKWFAIGADRLEINQNTPGKWKGSTHFMNIIDRCMDIYETSAVPESDFIPWKNKMIDKETLKHWFSIEYKHYPLAKRRERIIARIKQWIDNELKYIEETNIKKEKKKKATQYLNSYMKQWPKHTALSFYKTLFTTIKSSSNVDDIPVDIIKTTSLSCKKKEMDQEDLAPLVYIHNRLFGIESKQKFHHVIVDEAQDFSPIQIALLKQMTIGNSFTILGDLSQAIHEYQGINNWSEFIDVFNEKEVTYYELNRSYRSTMEIIHFANEIIKNANIPVSLANPVFRSGEKVKIIEVNDTNRIQVIINAIQQLKIDKMDTIAIIGRTEDECEILYNALSTAGQDVTFIHSKQRKYEGGISVVPIYLSKGLEFDAVLLVDVDDQHYEETNQDAKLLYVGCTRALHNLLVLYSGIKSPLIDHIDTTE
ncbi:UvrD-helicase domain-containing protein [Bacillus sp. AFS041924]|uniref:HelD family protein n=1 Tax=Bacillus sp. AFS041924 TaxID=2033503 RepID=UPI000BFC1EBF|nr:UvrD-helicase domain-containing protein [Bacillus sp. AFS041924]PGS53973.1 DNA helicase UvrD [Bacillus sp. AFS041924]